MASEQLKPVNGLYKVTKWIEDRGLKRAAVTNAPRPNAELMISLLGLSDFFNVVIVGSECDHPKPHPEPYLKALELLKASKDHTFIFEVCFRLWPQPFFNYLTFCFFYRQFVFSFLGLSLWDKSWHSGWDASCWNNHQKLRTVTDGSKAHLNYKRL